MIRTAQAVRHLQTVSVKGAHERMEALAALGQAGVALKDRSTQSTVIEAFGMLNASAVEPLIAVLPEANADQRLAIVTALCELYQRGHLNDKQKTVLFPEKALFVAHRQTPVHTPMAMTGATTPTRPVSPGHMWISAPRPHVI